MKHDKDKVDQALYKFFNQKRTEAVYPPPLKAFAVVADVLGFSLEDFDNEDAMWEAARRVIWGRVTGYTGPTAECPRLDYQLGPYSVGPLREAKSWTMRDRWALEHARDGEGRLRKPPVDATYLAKVLRFTTAEMKRRWAQPNFGLAPDDIDDVE